MPALVSVAPLTCLVRLYSLTPDCGISTYAVSPIAHPISLAELTLLVVATLACFSHLLLLTSELDIRWRTSGYACLFLLLLLLTTAESDISTLRKHCLYYLACLFSRMFVKPSAALDRCARIFPCTPALDVRVGCPSFLAAE